MVVFPNVAFGLGGAGGKGSTFGGVLTGALFSLILGALGLGLSGFRMGGDSTSLGSSSISFASSLVPGLGGDSLAIPAFSGASTGFPPPPPPLLRTGGSGSSG